jgi:hypothetical protein
VLEVADPDADSSWVRRISSFLLAFVWAFSGPTSPATAVCTPPELEFALRNAPTVFVGEVEELADQGHAAEMRVLAVWKGADLPQRVSTDGRPAAGTDPTKSRRYQLGVTYLVIPHNQVMPFPDDGCTATRVFAAQGALIPTIYQDAVGAEHGRLPMTAASATADPETESPTSSTPFIGGAAAVLLLTVAVLWLRKSRDVPANPQPRQRLAGALGGTTRRSGMRSVKRLRGSK